jgi:hypothetical protein
VLSLAKKLVTCIRTKSSAMVFLEYMRGTGRYLRFSLISTVDFYYVINKLIILILTHTNLVLIYHLRVLLWCFWGTSQVPEAT